MGEAVAALLVTRGADVHGVDVVPIERPGRHYQCDLGDEAAIAGLMKDLPGEVHVLLNCAGIPNGGRYSAAQVMSVNWLGLRDLTEGLLPRMPSGSAVVHVASTAGRGWADNEASIQELIDVDGFANGLAWVQAHADVCGDGYSFSKQVVQYYTMCRALQTIDDGIRMNAINPGVTNTQLIADFRRGVGDDVIDRAEEVAGRLAEPAEMAPAMLFLADEASASYINGVNLNVDRGTGAAHLTGSW